MGIIMFSAVQVLLLSCWKEVKVLEIVTAEEAGFCFGVERAIDMVFAAVEDHKDKSVYTLGPLIHNPQVVAKLEKINVRTIDSIDSIDNGILIIRSHGVEPDVYEKAEKKGLHIIDATCPFVKNAQKYARNLIKDGFQTFIYGDPDHPEVKGIQGAADYQAIIVKDLDDIKKQAIGNKVGIVAQTTKSPESFREIIVYLENNVEDLKIHNTICNTTEIRQRSAAKLAEKVDVMLVIGGKNSANTNRLKEICVATSTPTYHIETADEVDPQWLYKKNKVGITAGASTPDWLIREVVQLMNEENKELNVEETEEKEELNVEEAEEVEEVSEPETTEEEVSVEEETVSAEEQEVKYSDYDNADLRKGQKTTGNVVEINDNGVYVNVNYKTDGFIPLRHLSHRPVEDAHEVVNIDDEIEVVVLTLEDDEGNLILSKKQADYEKSWEKIVESYENDEIIEAEVTKEVKGGLVVDVGVRGFIPASHVAIGYVDDLSQYVGETMRLRVIEVERDNNNVVLSAKKVLEEDRAEQKDETLASLEEDQTVEGTVTKLVDFGAFIDLGGIEGLLHISEMSWGRIAHPSEVLEEGQKVEVKVLGVNREEERISLGLKQLLPDPWEEFAEKHYEGEIITGKITKIVDFGAFMEIEKGIEGLIHISQLSHRHVKTPDEVVTVGEEREAKIINVDADQERVGLSLKELEEETEKKPVSKKQKSSSNKKKESSSSSSGGGGATIREIVGDIFDQGN